MRVNVLWVFTHPEQRSLLGALCADGIRVLEAAGHDVRLSDLYAMKWKATVDRDDFTDLGDERLSVSSASGLAYLRGTLSKDIQAEQEKLEWADAVVIQFPMWWHGMPAMLKGWFDRVFCAGFGYWVTDPADPAVSLRYGDGKLAGKRALVVVNSGSTAESFGPRGINGPIEHVLFPLTHGILWYAGMSVLPPVITFDCGAGGEDSYQIARSALHTALDSIADAEPIPYRHQNKGDYDRDLTLRPDLTPGVIGMDAHKAS
jgi:NAD(P)H dehydrogenase (quinone)